MQSAVEGDEGTVGIDGVAVVYHPAGVAGLGGVDGVAVFNEVCVTLVVEMVADGAAYGVHGVEREVGFGVMIHSVAVYLGIAVGAVGSPNEVDAAGVGAGGGGVEVSGGGENAVGVGWRIPCVVEPFGGMEGKGVGQVAVVVLHLEPSAAKGDVGIAVMSAQSAIGSG